MALLRLFDPVNQFQTKSGALNTAGLLRVYLNGTDDYAAVHDDNGTLLEQPVRLDNNGRAPGLFVDSGKVYRLEVQDRYGGLLFTVMDMVPSGGGAGSSLGDKYDVISSDGSISVDRSVDGATTTYDIGMAPNDSDEFLEWIKCSENDCGATWYPVFQDGTMETEAGQGVKVHGRHLYHFTNSFTVDPDGTGVNYDTFRVAMYCGDEEVEMREFDIDSSLNDPVLCEFSRDVVSSEDTHVYFKLTIPATCKASGEVQCHRIYSGINAVPDTCATKQWVSASYQPLSGMSSYVPYSAVGNNGMGQVTGINGSAIAGGLDSASVSSIASSVASAYTESAFSSLSSKADSSALSAYQPVSAMGAYATTAYVDGMVSGKLDTSAFNSGDFYPTSNPSGFITGVDLSDYATTGFVESAVSGKLDTSAFSSASAGFQPTGDYAYNSALTAYIPASASGAFQPSGDYAFNSAVSSKLDASASSNFVMDSSMTSWIPYSALGYSGTAISGIGGSSLAGIGGGGVTGDYVEKSATEVAIGSNSTALKIAFAQGFRNSANNNSFAQGSSNNATSNSIAQGHWNSATKASFAQGSWNSADSESFAQGYSNSAHFNSFAQGENNSADSHSFAQGYWNSARSNSFAQGIRNSAVYTAAVFGEYNLHGNGWTGTGDSAAFAIGDGTADDARHDLMLVTKNGEITMYSSTADTVGLGLVSSIKAISAAATGGVDSATVSAIASAYAESAASVKLDSSASSMFQPSGQYQTAGDYAYNSSVSSKLDASASSQFAPSGNYADKSALSSYVPVSASGQFAPSGDYAYNSALNGKQDTLAFAYNTANQISSINGSAIGGMDEAAVSCIASAYAQSAASSKLDSSAFNSADFYSTSNPSGFITGVDLTPYQEKSAMTAYQPSGDYYSASNPSGFITLSDVPAQVNADWNAVSGVAEILNKPEIPSGTQLVPAATSADADKVLTVNAQGTPEWATGSGSQVQSDWTEADTAEPSYIQNKPVPKTLKAGTGIIISENASTITVASTVTAPVRDVTVDQTYDASSTNAQSGVAVADAIGNLGTNLSAVQLLALKEALGCDETVLYYNASGAVGTTPINLSESIYNFERVRIDLCSKVDANNWVSTVEAPIQYITNDYLKFCFTERFDKTWRFITWRCDYPITNNGTTITLESTVFGGVLDNGNWNSGVNVNTNFHLYKVVGIHRITSN